MKILKSYNVSIWVGMRKGYSDEIVEMELVRKLCDDFVNNEKDCITITPTEFRYVKGNEPGVIIGWIRYPRFPRTEKEIRERAFKLANTLMIEMGQQRVTVTTPTKSYMLENIHWDG